MTDKEIIRAWVKRREELLRAACKHSEAAEMAVLLSYIDSMQEKPVSDKLGGINNALIQDKCVQEHLVCNDLEDEITRYCNPIVNELSDALNKHQEYVFDLGVVARHFAEWQKQQMINGAVDATVCGVGSGDGEFMKAGEYSVCCDVPRSNIGDKVKLIIIKEN